MKDLIIIGAGGHARIVASILSAKNEYNILEFVDTYKKYEDEKINGVPVVQVNSIINYLKEKDIDNIFLAIGDNKKRKKLYKEVKNRYNFINCIHPNAEIEKNSIIGKGVFIGSGVVIGAEVKISDNVIINNGVVISHETKIGANSHLGPGVNIAGRVNVGSDTFIGIGSSVIDNLNIGNNVVIGAGSVVINNIKDNIRPRGINKKVISFGII